LPNLKLILYLRSNVVKHAVSFAHKKMLQDKCGINVMRRNQGCEVKSRFMIDVSSLGKYIINITAINAYLLEIAVRLAAYLEQWFWILKYEELLRDDGEVLNRLFEWIGYSKPKLRTSGSVGGRCITNCSKNTNDDLRKVILNYDEVENYILAEFPCLVSHLRETRRDRVMPSIDSSCPPTSFSGQKRFIESKKKFFTLNKKFVELCCILQRDDCICSW